MINVGMGDDDLFDLKIVFVNKGENLFDIVARINHHGFASDFVPDYGAIALQRPDRKDFVNHGEYSSVVSEESVKD